MLVASTADCKDLASQCRTHANSGTYKPTLWIQDGMWRCNNFIHNNDVPVEEAMIISRLLTGGQGLRGGDPKIPRSCTMSSCCVYCLERGTFTSETLSHVVFESPAYIGIRHRSLLRDRLDKGNLKVFVLHRKSWSWAELKALRALYLDIWRQAKEGLVVHE